MILSCSRSSELLEIFKTVHLLLCLYTLYEYYANKLIKNIVAEYRNLLTPYSIVPAVSLTNVQTLRSVGKHVRAAGLTATLPTQPDAASIVSTSTAGTHPVKSMASGSIIGSGKHKLSSNFDPCLYFKQRSLLLTLLVRIVLLLLSLAIVRVGRRMLFYFEWDLQCTRTCTRTCIFVFL